MYFVLRLHLRTIYIVCIECGRVFHPVVECVDKAEPETWCHNQRSREIAEYKQDYYVQCVNIWRINGANVGLQWRFILHKLTVLKTEAH